jgi:hypothetical protein
VNTNKHTHSLTHENKEVNKTGSKIMRKFMAFNDAEKVNWVAQKLSIGVSLLSFFGMV